MSVRVIRPPNVGWLEKKLSPEEMRHLWKCVEAGGNNCNSHLAGNISNSHIIPDLNDRLFYQTLLPLCNEYSQEFKNLAFETSTNQTHMLALDYMWVNEQKATEFQPNHEHNGVYSFVVWMKIPTTFEEQNRGAVTNTARRGCFEFSYASILGKSLQYPYDNTPEGTMLFFPSKLIHTVYPFYNCDETRISISGNLVIDTKTSIHVKPN
tara:strand:+ start:1793 stop:2419 length:627 start_codon:yes stop_codon:yes gene_type:complete